MEREEMVQALEDCEFFRGLGEHHIDYVLELCKPIDCNAGQCIFQQGDLGDEIYIVAEGRVVLERTVDLGIRKGKVTVDVLGKGRVLGCWSSLLGESHVLMSSAVCQRPTTVLAMKGSELRSIMLKDKELGFELMERFCFLLRERIQAAYGAMEKL